MKSSYSKTGNRPGKPGFRTQVFFVKRFLNKIRIQKFFRSKQKVFKSKYFNSRRS